MEASGSNRKTKQRKVVVKRRMDCCDWNTQQMTNARKATIQCNYCQCVFYLRFLRDEHMKIHECSECHDIALDDDVQVHKVRHQQEAQLEALQIQRQRKMDDDFVLCYIRANRLHQYRPQLDYEPDFDYIMLNYRFEKDEWLAFVNKFKRRFLDFFYRHLGNYVEHKYLDEQSNVEFISYLLENEALSVRDAIDFLNILMTKVRYDDYASVIVSHLLKKDYKIKSEWVARAINDDELVERVKERHTFTFDEIHKARKWDTYSAFDVIRLKTFYTQLQKHFFNPNFKNSFNNLHDEDLFRSVRVFPENRFIYDKQNDHLSMIVGSGGRQKTYALGSCADMMDKSLTDLVKQYMRAMKMYIKLHRKFNSLVAERDRRLGLCENRQERDETENYFHYEINKNTELERDEQGYEVSRVYFAISMK